MTSTFVKGINRGHWLHWDYYHILLKGYRNQSVPSSTYQKSDITFEFCSIKYIFDQNCKMDSKNGFLVPRLNVLLGKKRYFRKNRKITIRNYSKFRNSLFSKIAKVAKIAIFAISQLTQFGFRMSIAISQIRQLIFKPIVQPGFRSSFPPKDDPLKWFITEGNMKCPYKHSKRDFAKHSECICILIWNAQKSKNFIFLFLGYFKINLVILIWNT